MGQSNLFEHNGPVLKRGVEGPVSFETPGTDRVDEAPVAQAAPDNQASLLQGQGCSDPFGESKLLIFHPAAPQFFLQGPRVSL